MFWRRKKLIWKEGSRQLLSLSFSLNEFQAARVSAWQESCHPVIRTTQRILFSSSWVVIMAVCRVGNKMSVFWEELWDVPCRGLHQCPPGWLTRCCEACLHDTWYQRGYHLDIWPAEEISLGRLFSDIITMSERLKWPLPPPSWPMVQQTLQAEGQSLWLPALCEDNGETYLKQTREHINIRVIFSMMFAQHRTFVCFYQGAKMKCKCKRKEELPAED